MSHLDPAVLLGHAEGQSLATAARAHLERCARCTGELAALITLIEDMRADRAPLPPEALVQQALALFRRRPRPRARVLETVARLLRDALDPAPGLGGALPAGAGIRGGQSPARRLLFAGEGLEVDVEVDPGEDGLRVTGQVVATGGGELPLLAWAERGGRVLATAPVGDHGMFLLDRFPPAAF